MTNRFGTNLSPRLTSNYFLWMINQFYKILPLRESNSQTLQKYICSLQHELLGCGSFVPMLSEDERFMSLLSILEYLRDQNEELTIVRSEVFKAISIIKKLQTKYAEPEV